jgi:leucyl/phenylalanyl-tRNA--protein transferase
MLDQARTKLRPIRKFLGHHKRRLAGQSKELQKKFYRKLSYPLRKLPGGPDAGICYLTGHKPFSADLVIMAYAQGMFQLGTESGRIVWQNPTPRAVIFTDAIHVSRRLKDYIRKGQVEIRYNTAFEEVMRGCADRETTWITPEIIHAWTELRHRGLAHSVEAWQDGQLVGGGYGLALGSFFALESMFFTVSQASKVAFVHLAENLRDAGFALIDIQYQSTLWRRFGAVEIPREEYNQHLARAIVEPIKFEPQTTTRPELGISVQA